MLFNNNSIITFYLGINRIFSSDYLYGIISFGLLGLKKIAAQSFKGENLTLIYFEDVIKKITNFVFLRSNNDSNRKANTVHR